jgi:hypothetical protein
MDTVAVISRKRTVMTIIADAIVTAAVGRSLRVAIACTDYDEIAFAGQLTQDLRARGRPCRCLQMEPPSAVNAGSTSRSQPDNLIAAVIVGGWSGPEELGLCRVDIQLQGPALGAMPRTSSPYLERDQGSCCDADDGRRANIVGEQFPEGPTIRHLRLHSTLG